MATGNTLDGKPYAATTLRIITAAFFVFAAGMGAFAAEVAPDAAQEAVAGWVRLKEALGEQFDAAPASTATYQGRDGKGVFHVVSFEGGGYVVTSGDTDFTPILAWSKSGEFAATDENPLWCLIAGDTAARAEAPSRSGLSYAAATASPAAGNAARWAALRAAAKPLSFDAAPSITSAPPDLRVPALAPQNDWSQSRIGNYSGTDYPVCFNYYTPANWPCGYVATSSAQVMRYFRWPQADNPVDVASFPCTSNDVAVTLSLMGGTYDWDNMPENINSYYNWSAASTETWRQAVGKLCHDAGVAVKMEYGPSGSGAYVADVPGALVNTFHYSNAVLVRGDVIKALLSSLDAKTPCVVSIEKNGSSTGHAVMADGYGYSDNTLYVHFNMGWRSSNCNVWYNPPLFDRTINGEVVTKYDTINSVVCNISTNAARYSSIASGRVFDLSGNAVPGAAVTATCDGATAATATTDANGIYALYLPPSESEKTYSITATLNGRGSTSTTVSASRTYSKDGTEINSNSRDNDLVLGVLYAKAVNGALAYFSDEDCTLPTEIPAEGLAACKKVLFADDAEFQTLVPFTNEIAAAGVPVCLQSNVTLTADADWRAIDFDMNGKTVTLAGYDLKIRSPQGTGRITSGNVIVTNGFTTVNTTKWYGDGLYQLQTNNKLGLKQTFTLPKSRPCYLRFRYHSSNKSGYTQKISAGIDSNGGGNYNNMVSGLQTGSATSAWSAQGNSGVYVRSNLEAGTTYQLNFARTGSGYTYCGWICLSPTSYLYVDVPEGEAYDLGDIELGGVEEKDYTGMGLQIHKTGKGKLVMNKANTRIGGYGATANIVSMVVEEGVVENANDRGCGPYAARIEVKEGAQFDTHGAASSNDARYDFILSGAGPDGLGAVANNTEVASAYDKAFVMRNITLATNAVIGGTQNVSLKNGDWTATTMTMGGHTIMYTNTTVYAGNMSYSGTGGIVVAPDAALSFYAHSTAAADCDVTVHGSLNQNNGGFTQVKSLVFETGSTCWLSDSTGSGSIPETVVTEKYAPNPSHSNGGNCTLTTPKVQLGDDSHLETTLDLSRLEGVFDGTNTTFYAGSTVTVDLGNREFQGSVLLIAWAEMPTATFVVDDANYDRLGLMPRPEGLYIFPGKVPSFVKYDVENNRWAFYDEDVNPFSGEWTLGMDYMKALFADDAEFQALAQHTNEIAASHVTVFLQDDITLTADADWRALDFDMNGKTVTLAGYDLKIRRPQGTGRITSGNVIVTNGFTTLGSANWQGDGFYQLKSNNTLGIKQTFTLPKSRPCYLRFRYHSSNKSGYTQKISAGIASNGGSTYNNMVSGLQTGSASSAWTAQGNSDIYVRTGLEAGTPYQLNFARTGDGYTYCGWICLSPESHLYVDVPEGEEYNLEGIDLGGEEERDYTGIGLQIHKTGKGTLVLDSARSSFGGNRTTSLVIEEGLAINTCSDGQAFCGGQYSTIEVCDGAQFDFNGHRYHDYHYSLAGSGPDGTGALVNTASMSSQWTVDGSKCGMLYNVTLADDATIGGTEKFGMIFYDNGAHTMTMNNNTVTYAGTEIFAGQMNYSGDGRIVVATNATLRSCTSSATAGGCDVEVRGILGQQDGKVLSPVKSLVFVEGGKFHNLQGTPAAVTVYGAYAPNVEAGEGSTVPHPIVNLGDASHLETTLDLSRWTDTFDDSAEGSLTFQAGSTVTVDIGERTQGLGKPAFLWKDAPDETVKFKPSDAMKRRGVFVVSREDGVYFKTGFTVIIR